MSKGDVKKVVLAYSGGLDTSIILKWLQDDLRLRGRDLHRRPRPGRGARAGAQEGAAARHQAENIFIEDLREEFVRDYVFPMFRANALYEGQYLLGTSIARPLIAKKQIEIAEKTGADAVAHGATGKGNDQVRFELALLCAQARHQGHRAVARVGPHVARRSCSTSPRSTRSRSPRTSAARRRSRSTPTCCTPRPKARCWRTRRRKCPTTSIRARSIPRRRPTSRPIITVDFERGDAVAIDGKKLSPAALLTKLNELGRANGIGRLDLVENRFVGMKSRGIYETPGGTILLAAHRGIESITLDRGAAHLKDELMPRYARADLQRLLVLARARDAAGADRQAARNSSPAGCG